MKKTVFILLVLAVTVTVSADDMGYAGFILTYTMPDFTELSTDFREHGFPAVDEEIITYGGGAWGGERNLLFGVWGFHGSKDYAGDSGTVDLGYSGIFFEPGYFINIYKGFGIMPSVGLGASKVKLGLREILGDVSFDELLNDPTRISEAKYRTFTTAPALTISIPIEFIALQIKGGYMWSPIAGKWKLADEANLMETPNINPSGIFASAALVFGGDD